MGQTDKTLLGVGRAVAVAVLCMACAVLCSEEGDNQCIFLEAGGEYSAPWEESCEYSFNLNDPVGQEGEEEKEEQMEMEIEQVEEKGIKKAKGKEKGEGKEKEEKEAKRKNEKYEEWGKEVPLSILQKTTVANLKKVIAVNKAALNEVNARQRADLKGTTGCRVGSLEWINKAKETLQRVAERMEEKEIREILESAVKRYEGELRERRATIQIVIGKWILDYRRTLNALYRDRETVVQLFRDGGWKGKVLEMAADAEIHANTYGMMAKALQKGLEDLARGRSIQDLRRNADVAKNLEKKRECRTERSMGDGTSGSTGVENHLKNTIFYPVIAIFCSDCHHRSNHEQQQIQKSFVSINDKLTGYRGRLEALEALEGECLGEVGRKEVGMRKEEVEVLLGVCRYLEGYVKRAKLTGEHLNVVYVEGVEAYVMEQAREGGGRLERVIRALYRIMEESGHLENVRRKGRGEQVAKGYLTSNYKNKIMSKWLKMVSSEMSKPTRRRRKARVAV